LPIALLAFAGGKTPVTQVVTEIAPSVLGRRPYEIEWAGRKEPRSPTIMFGARAATIVLVFAIANGKHTTTRSR
jgi:hypothetical protein